MLRTRLRSWLISSKRHAQALLQVDQQFENLALHRHVQCRGRFIGDQQLRLALARAIAIITRWRWPPDNWWG
jgi:ABC-type polar amino acid transport system ATPase subunit